MSARSLLIAVSPLAVLLASCGHATSGENVAPSTEGSDAPFTVEQLADFDEPWAMAFAPGTETLFVTERKGALRFRTSDGKLGTVSGVPSVAYGGQGGLGDVAFAPEAGNGINGRTIYLSWAEEGINDTRGAAVGKATLACTAPLTCSLQNLKVIWRQVPKVTGKGHYSHRLTFSPDGKYLFVSSGDRQKFIPAQDLGANLGKVLRLLPDGSPAPGNPYADKPAPTNEVWSYGHRNVLGIAFDRAGNLWDLEHGPAGGDEINLVQPGKNYGWPLVSNGDHYDGKAIPRHATRPDLTAPAISWTPVLAPGDFLIYTGDAFPAWKDKALVAGMVFKGLVAVSLDAGAADSGAAAKGTELARYPLDNRIRDITQASDGSVWLIEDGEGSDSGHLLRLTPRKPS